MARIRRRNVGAEIRTSAEVRVPERVFAVGKIDPRLTNRDVKAVFFHGAQERHLDIQVVLTKCVVDHSRPIPEARFPNHAVAPSEFRRGFQQTPAICSDPAALHLVAIFRNGEFTIDFPSICASSARTLDAKRPPTTTATLSAAQKNFLNIGTSTLSLIRREIKRDVLPFALLYILGQRSEFNPFLQSSPIGRSFARGWDRRKRTLSACQ